MIVIAIIVIPNYAREIDITIIQLRSLVKLVF